VLELVGGVSCRPLNNTLFMTKIRALTEIDYSNDDVLETIIGVFDGENPTDSAIIDYYSNGGVADVILGEARIDPDLEGFVWDRTLKTSYGSQLILSLTEYTLNEF